MAWRDWDDRPPASVPRRVKGGIRAHAQRGRFVEHWWGARWLAVLEKLKVGGRLDRGKRYARSGQVMSIAVAKGLVTARVQGSRPVPYDVVIEVARLKDAEWKAATGALVAQAGVAARLLAGDMPPEIEDVFGRVGLSLFPTSYENLQTRCSCPDESNPCKHIAAVYYLLGEEFDRDPFLILLLRGLGRDELVAAVGRRGEGGGTPRAEIEARETTQAAGPLLSADPARFWKPVALAPDFFGSVEAPASPDATLQRFGRFPFWRGRVSVLEALSPVYREATPIGMDLFVGADADEESDALG